ncbi:MAG: hypothetical protein ACRBBS_16860 [Thalassovita sp.]
MAKARPSLFLERKGYRQRRVRDMARLMPFVGAILWGVPVLWAQPGEFGISTSRAILYIFGVWVTLVVITLGVTRWLDPDADADQSDGH